MPYLLPALIGLGALLGLLWLLAAGMVFVGSWKVKLLADVLPPGTAAPTGNDPGAVPSLSVVITARNEAEAIEETVRSLLRQRYPRLEIVVVNDRSDDETRAVLDRLASEGRAEGPFLRVIHIEILPDGWTGKCHACHLGATQSKGEWILFTDGDVRFRGEELLERIVAHAQRRRLDHVAVIPDLRPMPPVQAALVAIFDQMFMAETRAYEMDRDLPRGGVGVGAFNLVKRSAYERVGGHELLKMDLVDDLRLGQLLKQSGARQRLFNGLGLVLCRWHRGALNVMAGLEKNFFAGLDFSLWKLCVWTTAIVGLNFGPAFVAALVTVLTWHKTGLPLLVAIWMPFVAQTALIAAGYVVEARRNGYRPLAVFVFHPLAVVLLVVAAWNSAVRTLARGGVLWRGTFYPLDRLRDGLDRAGGKKG